MAGNRRGKQPKDETLRSEIAERFRAAYDAYKATQPGHVTQAGLAPEALGVSPQVLSKALNGNTFPDEAMLIKFCRLSEVPTDWIYRGQLMALCSAGLAAGIQRQLPHEVSEAAVAALEAARAAIAAIEAEARALLAAHRAAFPETAAPSARAGSPAPLPSRKRGRNTT